jgi:type IV pilus assembly protein PilC
MAIYFYKAVDKVGRLIRGSVNGASQANVETLLKSQGLTLVKLEGNVSSKFKKSAIDLQTFFKQLAILLEQHITLKDALEIMTSTANKRQSQKFFVEILETIKSGQSFATAIRAHIMNPFVIESLESAEKTGQLDQTCKMLGKNFEVRDLLNQQHKKAVAYPIGVLIAILCFIIITLRMLIPNIRSVVNDTSSIMFTLSDMSIQHPYACLCALCGMVSFGVIAWMRALSGIGQSGIWWLHSVAILLQAGIPLKSALTLSISQTGKLKAVVEKINHDVFGGKPLHSALRSAPLIPPSAAKFAEIGSACGLLGDMLAQCAQMETQRHFDKIQRRIALVQPVLLSSFGIILVWLVVSVFSPLYDNMPAI